MFVYLLICLFLPYLVLENFVIQKRHSREQRLLPLVMGLSCLYMFYEIVEYLTKATNVFSILKDLLAMQLMLLLFFYILDISKLSLKKWICFVSFTIIGIANILVCVLLFRGSAYSLVAECVVIFYSLLDVGLAVYTVLKTGAKTRTRKMYLTLYIAMLFPFIAMIISLVGNYNGMILMPGGIGCFSIIVNYMIFTGQFYLSEDFIKENLFHSYDGMLFLYDTDFYYLDASDMAKERFPEKIKELEKNRLNYDFLGDIREWSLHPHTAKIMDVDESCYKVELQPVSDGRGKNKGYILSLADITSEMKEINAVKHQSELKSDFLANMSHELRSPLNAIIGGSDIVIKRGNLPESSRLMMGRIGQAGISLLEIVNSILDYSKLEAGRLELKEEEYDLKTILEGQCYAAVVSLKNKPVRFECEVKRKLPMRLIGDESRVEMIIRNLFSNACKYTDDGLINCKISSEVVSENQVLITLTVKDTGSGISKKNLQDIFEKYVTHSDISIAESTGVGLYTVKQLSNMMGGDITASSDGKTGSKFTVTFLQKFSGNETYNNFFIDESIINKFVQDEWETVVPDYIYPEGRVLVVDDMKVNREVFAGKAAPWQFTVDEAESGETSIEMVKERDYDLIFMDQMMPGMSGMDAALEIKKLKDIPIVLLTANTSDEMKKEALDAKLDSFMPKPILIELLKNNIEELMPKEKRILVTQDPVETTYEIIRQDENYHYVLEAYIEDIEDIIPRLKGYIEEDDLESFRIKVHGIKGTSRQIGKLGIGDLSEVMEMASKANHKKYIVDHLDSYIEDLTIVVNDAKNELERLYATSNMVL